MNDSSLERLSHILRRWLDPPSPPQIGCTHLRATYMNDSSRLGDFTISSGNGGGWALGLMDDLQRSDNIWIEVY